MYFNSLVKILKYSNTFLLVFILLIYHNLTMFNRVTFSILFRQIMRFVASALLYNNHHLEGKMSSHKLIAAKTNYISFDSDSMQILLIRAWLKLTHRITYTTEFNPKRCVDIKLFFLHTDPTLTIYEVLMYIFSALIIFIASTECRLNSKSSNGAPFKYNPLMYFLCDLADVMVKLRNTTSSCYIAHTFRSVDMDCYTTSVASSTALVID